MRDKANSATYYQTILDAIPLPVFVVDHDVSILDFNPAAADLLKSDRQHVLRRRGGDVMHCIHSTETPEGCGRAHACSSCLVRGSVGKAITGSPVNRRKTRMELLSPEGTKEVDLLVTTAALELPEGRHALLILEDISELITLRGLLPICARCKSIRDDRQFWQTIENYLQAHLELDFSHGLCPDCTREMYPDLYEKLMARRQAETARSSAAGSGEAPAAKASG